MQNKKLAALVAVMALGAASAQTTDAGTVIRNIASATYDVPGAPAGTTNTVPSNEVTTVVNPVPNFTITPNDGGTAGVPDQDAPGQTKTNIRPGATVEFPYTVTNTGNTPLVVQLDPRISSANVDRSDTDVQNLTYYVVNADGSRTQLTDTNGDGLVEVPELAPDAKANIIQVYTIPGNATSTQVFGANPVGTALYDNDATDGVAVGNITTNPDVATATSGGQTIVDNDNFNQVILVKPGVTTNPTPDPTNPDQNPNTPGQDGNVVVPPTSGTPGDSTPGNGTPTNPVQPGSPEDGTTDAPTTSGYDDPNGVNISIVGDKQIAYPPADTNSDPDQVTFNNVVTNNGPIADTVTIFPPTVTNADGSPVPAGTTAVITGLTDADNNPSNGIQVTLQPGQTLPYNVVVTYPDNDGSATKRPDIVVTIGVDSGNDGDTTPDATTVDIVRPPAMQFGDSTADLGAAPAPAPVQAVSPTGADTGVFNDLTTTTDGTASFPMDVVNTGAYNDTYTLSATVPGIPGATVTYYDANGNKLPQNASGQYITPVVAAGSELKVYAVVTNIPDNTPAGDYTLSQTATANYSGIQLTDTNDIIRVTPVGNVALAKFTQGGAAPFEANGIQANSGYGAGPSTANPGAPINYQIIARNAYNAPVTGFFICDKVPANTTFASISDTDNVANIYRVSGGAWSTAAPTAGLAAGTEVCVGNDANGDRIPDALPSGGTYTVNFSSTVN